MITNVGKGILGKYLIGHTESYASYIAVGCGPKPKPAGYDFTPDIPTYAQKTSLDFEMLRVPIESRGYVLENGVEKIVFTASLPTEERYEITEVGVFSAGSNSLAGIYDSKTLLTFSGSENWKLSGTDTIYTATENIAAVGDTISVTNNSVPQYIFQANADNAGFSTNRINRQERPRFLNNSIFIAGDQAVISGSAGAFNVTSSQGYIKLENVSFDLDGNSPTDELRFAFSVLNKSGSIAPKSVKILIKFMSDDQLQSANMEIQYSNPGTDFSNRYFVATKKLSELSQKTSGFLWSKAKVVEIYACVINSSDEPTEDYYVALDALRLENTSGNNPLYGLTGYTVIQDSANAENPLPIVKKPNTSNFVEFRFAMDVV